MDTSPSIPESQSHHQSQQPPSGTSGGPQIRSRVTVVCAECKRLKLKCDRRTPCGSCTKRDTVARCVYSPAAAEKVDLHSLNNRLTQVESQLAQFTAPGARSHNFYSNAPGPSHHADRALLAVGQSGSSLAISLDDITTIWMSELDVGEDVLPTRSPSAQSSCPSHPVAGQVKLEPSPVTLPAQDPKSGYDCPVHLLLPPLSAYYTSPSPTANEAPSVTSRLLTHIPFAPRKRQKLYDNIEDVLKMHPCFNFKHFKDRTEAMFRWASEVEGTDGARPDSSSVTSRPSTSGGLPSATKAETARAIFFGSSSSSSISTRSQPPSRPTISFFAAVAAAFALGTLVDREIADEEARSSAAVHGDGIAVGDSSSSSRPPSRKKSELLPVPSKKCKGVSKDTASSPAVLFALSQQALSLFEKSSPYDLDFLVAMILHVLYALHDSKARVAQSLLPDVGKMINVARTMGLDTDPDEFPGKFNLFDAESRRRLWWDIFYYDLFVSDFMGRSPLISDMEHTTRLPMDVDEDAFTPVCTSIPLPRNPLSLSEPNLSDFKYFGLKCRLAQLVKDIKRRSLRDSLQNDSAACEQFTLDQATSCANEIKQWLADLPATFRLDINWELSNVHGLQSLPPDIIPYSSSSLPRDTAAVSPVLLAQRCELAVIAQRLIMKVYIPFLRPSWGRQGTTTHYQATVGTFTAAHIIIRSLKVLCSMWKQRPDLKGRRPTPALFNFYSFGRSLFDAAVVCAHNVVRDPNSVWVRIAMEDVSDALELMRDPMLNTGRGPMRGGAEGSVHEAIRIVALLQRKAQGTRTLYVTSAGTKRKHDELEVTDGRPHTGFQFPFVSGSVQSAGTLVQSTSSTASPSGPGPHSVPVPTSDISASDIDRNVSQASPAEGPLKRPSSAVVHTPTGENHGSGVPSHKAKCKDKHAKKCPYPQSGIRVRPGKEPPQFSRTRFTPSIVTSELDANTELALPPAPLSQTPSLASTPVIEHPQYQHPLPFAQTSQANASCDGTANQHHLSAQELSDGVAVDFSLPFGAADQAHADANVYVSRSQRYNHIEMNADLIEPRQISKLSPAPSTYDHSQNTPFINSSPIGQSGNYSNINSPFSSAGPASLSAAHFASNGHTPHDQRSTPFEMSSSSQSYFAYGPRYQDTFGDQSNPISLVNLSVEPSMTINRGGDDGRFLTGDATSRDGPFRYSDKSHHAMYPIKPPELHPVSGPPFLHHHSQQVSETWSQESPIPESSRFWHSYEPFPS